MKIKLISFFAFFMIIYQIKAQQMPIISNFMYNRLVYNPAAAGTMKSQFNANAITRLQWSDIPGAPLTNMFWSDYRFNAYKMAVGLNVSQDRVGGYSNIDFMANYSYYINVTNSLKLSFGLRGGFASTNYAPGNRDKLKDQDDPSYDQSSYSFLLPKIGLGFQLYNDKFYVSLSAPDMYVGDQNNLQGDRDKSFFDKKRNFILMSGYHLKLSDQYAIYPNILASYHPINGTRFDANMLFEVTDYFWFGGTYSTSNNHSLIIGTNLSARIKFGYSYGLKLGNTNGVTLTTHELNLMITLDNLFKKKKS